MRKSDLLRSTLLDIPALSGIHAATVCPLHPDATIDEKALREHVSAVAACPGIRGLLVNGHAGEGHLMSPEERRRVLAIVRQSVPKTCFITAGITSESTAAAIGEAADAGAAGADAILIFPPNHWALGMDAQIVLAHHRAIVAACELPTVLYKAPLGWNRLSYDIDLIARLCDIPQVAGIKEGAWEVSAYEELWRRVKHIRAGISVMASGDEHLMACYQIGTDGSQVSLAALVPDRVVALYEAAGAGDWAQARRLHDEIYALVCRIYRHAPGYLATARLKAALCLTGRIGSDTVRGPMRQLTPQETAYLSAVLPKTRDQRPICPSA